MYAKEERGASTFERIQIDSEFMSREGARKDFEGAFKHIRINKEGKDIKH